MEYGLEGVHYYDPPNLTYPYGSYIVVVEVDPETGVWKVRRMVALDDCGVRINPMIVEGQIHGGLTEGFAMSSMQWITFDEDGNCIGSNFMDYLIPTAWETPKFELLETCVPSPHHPIGAKGVGESATVGSPAAYVNAVIDALAHLGVRNIDMPLLPDRVWTAIRVGAGAPRADGRRASSPRRSQLTQARRRLRARDGGVAARAELRARRVEGDRAARRHRARLPRRCVRRADAWSAKRSARSATASPGCCSSARPTSSTDARLDGTITVPMACESEGALEVYLEPFLPAPQLVVVGRSPAVHALTDPGAPLDWDVAVIDDGGRASDHPHPELVRTTLDLSGLGIGPSTAIVVATQGHYDDLALEPRSRPTPATSASSPRRSARRRSAGAARGRDRATHSWRGCTRRPGSTSARSTTPRSRSRCSPTSSPAAPPASSAATRTRSPAARRSTRCAA